VEQTGFWPVIVGATGGLYFGGSDAVIEMLVQGARSIQEMEDKALQFCGIQRTPMEILNAARDLPFERWVERQRDPDFQERDHLRKANYYDGLPGAARLAEHHREWAGRWREGIFTVAASEGPLVLPRENRNPPQHELRSVMWLDVDRGGLVFADSVAILLVPTRFSWQVPAYLFYSTLENDRPPSVHVAALKWLCDRFGAHLVGIQDRVLEVIPQSRPGTAKDALEAAETIAAYSNCPVTSENELALASELAVYLMESEYWSFCWP
jgi:hypothetical protein